MDFQPEGSDVGENGFANKAYLLALGGSLRREEAATLEVDVGGGYSGCGYGALSRRGGEEEEKENPKP